MPRWSTPHDPRRVAERLDAQPSAGIVLFLEDGEVVARRDGDEDVALLDTVPDGRVRAAAALRNPNAGEVLVSAAPGWEFLDLAGRHHRGGGSHGSLEAADSEVPMLTVGLGDAARVDHAASRRRSPRTSVWPGRRRGSIEPEVRGRSARELLGLPVRMHGIQLGRPVDAWLDTASDRLVGFEIHLRRRRPPVPAVRGRDRARGRAGDRLRARR